MFSNEYQYFLAVAKTGSFHKASQELFVSQPAVSKQIKNLEDKLGYPLFKRTTRVVNLTPEGKILYAALLECTEIINKATSAVVRENTKQSLTGTLRVGILSHWGIDQFRQPYLTAFFEQNPGVELFLVRMEHQELVGQRRRRTGRVIRWFCPAPRQYCPPIYGLTR